MRRELERLRERVAQVRATVVGRGCNPGVSCPGPRYTLRLTWPEDEPAEPCDVPCPQCNRHFRELSRLEQWRAWRRGVRVVSYSFLPLDDD